jgi:hypothetical protein
MGFAAVLGLLSPIFTDLIKRVFPDPEKAAEAQIELQKLLGQAQVEAYKVDAVAMEAKKEVITTEMKGGWTGKWRSYLMLTCISIVSYNLVIVSFLNAFLRPLGFPIESLTLPPEVWTFVTVGLGGYLTKETVSNYQQGRIETAKVNNPAYIDEDMLAKALRKNLFKDGMTQAQWEAILVSAKSSVKDE